jgi:hypothetical protein
MTGAKRLLIAGECGLRPDGAKFETCDPATGRLLAICAVAGLADIDDASATSSAVATGVADD